MGAMSELDVMRQTLAEDPAGTVRPMAVCSHCRTLISGRASVETARDTAHRDIVRHVWQGWTLANDDTAIAPALWTADPCPLCFNPWASIERYAATATRQAVES